jgi:hypothetical protein
MTFKAFGVGVQVTLGDEDLATRVLEILPPGRSPCKREQTTGHFGLRASNADAYKLTMEAAPLVENATLDVALGMLDAQIRMFIAANAPDRIFVHAGVVACDGRAVVLPGESFSGKTTLVAALVREGATYYSDEYAVLDADGRVHPYARRLSIRSDGGEPAQERHVGELGGVAAEESAEVSAVVVTRYRRDAVWQPTRLSAGEGVVALLANTVPAQERPEESLRVLSRAVTGAIVLESDRGEAGHVAAALLDELAAPAAR